MHKLWVLIFALGVASGDKEFDYKVPHTSYGVPSYQLRGTSEQLGYTGNSYAGYNYKPPVNKFSDHSSSNEYASSTLNQKFENEIPSSFNTFQSGGTNDLKLPLNPISQYNFNRDYHSTSQEQAAQKYQQYYYTQNQPTEVYRHFYIHSAPEEPELPKFRLPIPLPPPQKHYKIIFVKAPTESQAPQIIPVAPQTEEKTIVYVLVKKPEDPEVIVPKIEQKPPTKPEVYYIKYNNKQDSQAVIDNIVKDYNKGNILTESSADFGAGQTYNSGILSSNEKSSVFSTGLDAFKKYETGYSTPPSNLYSTNQASSSYMHSVIPGSSSNQYSFTGYGAGMIQQPLRPFPSSPIKSVSFGTNRFQQSLTPLPYINVTSGGSGITFNQPLTGHLTSNLVTSGSSGTTFIRPSTEHLSSSPVTSGGYVSSTGQQLASFIPSRNVNTGGLPTAAIPTGSLTTNSDFSGGSQTIGGLPGGSVTTVGLPGSSLTTGGLTQGSITTGPYRPPPITLSPTFSTTTASSLLNNQVNAISTSQGVPHETYGPPNFRPN